MPPPTEKRGRAIVWVPIVLVALSAGFGLGGLCGYFYGKYPHDKTGTDKEIPEPLDKVVALGRIEPYDGILSLGVSAPDRIREIKVEEDQVVKAGQSLVILESQKMRELEKQLAVIQRRDAETRLQGIEANGKAQIAVAQLRLDRIKKLEPLEITVLESKKDLLIKQEKNAARNYTRYLNAGDTIAGMDKEKQELAQQQLETEIGDTKKQIEKLETSSKLDHSLAKAQLQAAEAELQQTQSTISLEALDKQVAQAEERLRESELLAPSEGKILRIFSHKGDLVQSKPILQMANVKKMIVLAEVDEKDVQRVHEKQTAIITSPAFAKGCGELKGKVIWIASNIGKAEMAPLDPRAAVSDRVVHVKVALEEPKCVEKLIGLQVHVEIETKEAAKQEQ